MIIRFILLYCEYFLLRIKLRKRVWFRGFSVIHALKGSIIEFPKKGERMMIFSSPMSNMIGLPHRTYIVAKNGGRIKFEEGVCMSGVAINAIDSIIIKRNTIIGAGCKIFDNDSHPLPYSLRYPEKKLLTKYKPVLIGEGCFIGTNSIILKGTILGNNVVVGAGSVVSGEFPDNVIIAGNPAKIVKANKL